MAIAGALAVAVDGALHLHRVRVRRRSHWRHPYRLVVEMHRDADVAAAVGDDLPDDASTSCGSAPPFVSHNTSRHAPACTGLLRGRERELRHRAYTCRRSARRRRARRGRRRGGTRPSRGAIATPSSSVVPSASVTATVRRLPDDAHRAHVRLDEMPQGVVTSTLPLTRRVDRTRRACSSRSLQLGRDAPEQLVVLRVRTGVTGFDVVDAEVIELLRDATQLVLDRERDPFELRPVAQRRVGKFRLAVRRPQPTCSHQSLYLST